LYGIFHTKWEGMTIKENKNRILEEKFEDIFYTVFGVE